MQQRRQTYVFVGKLSVLSESLFFCVYSFGHITQVTDCLN